MNCQFSNVDLVEMNDFLDSYVGEQLRFDRIIRIIKMQWTSFSFCVIFDLNWILKEDQLLC